MLLLSHLTGTPNSREAARAYAEAGWLAECHHSLAWTQAPRWWKALPERWRALLKKRIYPEIPAHCLRRHPTVEFALRTHHGTSTANDLFDRRVAHNLHHHRADLRLVHGYFDTSLLTFRAAKSRGLRTVYELPTPYWRAVEGWVEPERRRRPEWAGTLPSTASHQAASARRDEELQLADLILVPSPLVRDSLELAPKFRARVEVVPYGCPEATRGDPVGNDERRTAHRAPLKLLFAGTLSQSKGLADLIEAILPLGDQVRLSVAGSARGSLPASVSSCSPRVHWLGQLPHPVLQQEMRQHDVLVLPTWYEGLSLTLLEAMSAGLAILTTTRSGLLGLIEPGHQAVLVPPGEPAALRQEIQTLIAHPSRLHQLRQAAQTWATQHTWATYRQQLHAIVAPLVG